MKLLAKSLEALGIACVAIGWGQTFAGNNTWFELYFFVGVGLFLLGWWIEKRMSKRESAETHGTPNTMTKEQK